MKRATDFDNKQHMFEFLRKGTVEGEPNPKTHKKGVWLSNGTVFRTVFPVGDGFLPTIPAEKTSATAVAQISREDSLAARSESSILVMHTIKIQFGKSDEPGNIYLTKQPIVLVEVEDC